MKTQHPLDAFGSRLRDFIERGFPSDDAVFNRLALELFALQFEHNQPYQRLCVHRGVTPERLSDWRDIPAAPTFAFKELELTSLAREERTKVFHSSGTTRHSPSRHFHNAASLAVYEASLLAWFERHLVSGETRQPMLALTPRASESPNSSLVHMVESVVTAFGTDNSRFAGRVGDAGGWMLDGEAALQFLAESHAENRPVAILGTAFSFVHLLDFLETTGARFVLPDGSCVMETGGYKGRSRELPKAELHRLITERLGVPSTHLVCEYGMSELSSQAYDHSVGTRSTESLPLKVELRDAVERVPTIGSERVFHFPPWSRVQIVSPETGREASEGETGLIRNFDLANVGSVLAVQTEDLGVRRGDGFELLGRAAAAEARGCSLMAV